jgi:hypothetical protein
MKLYLWRGPNVLLGYRHGIAGAYANSLEEARRLVTSDMQGFWDFLTFPGDEDTSEYDEKLAFIADDPEIFEAPVSFYQYGGD